MSHEIRICSGRLALESKSCRQVRFKGGGKEPADKADLRSGRMQPLQLPLPACAISSAVSQLHAQGQRGQNLQLR